MENRNAAVGSPAVNSPESNQHNTVFAKAQPGSRECSNTSVGSPAVNPPESNQHNTVPGKPQVSGQIAAKKPPGDDFWEIVEDAIEENAQFIAPAPWPPVAAMDPWIFRGHAAVCFVEELL